jgi:hypothetical protein
MFGKVFLGTMYLCICETRNALGMSRKTEYNPQVVFKGPVYRTEKKTETGLNWTDKDRTSGLFMDRSFAVQLQVFHFEKIM